MSDAEELRAITYRVIDELFTWAASDAGKSFHAPGWWERIFHALGTIMSYSQQATAQYAYYACGHVYVAMMEHGPMTREQILEAMPSYPALRAAVDALYRQDGGIIPPKK